MKITCEQYLEEPEAHEEHLGECEACAAMFGELDAPLAALSGSEAGSVSLDALPLAPWEGASHRTWPLVIVGALSVLILTAVLFLAAGVSPLRGIVHALLSAVPSLEILLDVSQMAGGALHRAPAAFHVAVAVGFVVINSLLFLLLRRAPRGIDV
jgi:hypothetical protein